MPFTSNIDTKKMQIDKRNADYIGNGRCNLLGIPVKYIRLENLRTNYTFMLCFNILKTIRLLTTVSNVVKQKYLMAKSKKNIKVYFPT